MERVDRDLLNPGRGRSPVGISFTSHAGDHLIPFPVPGQGLSHASVGRAGSFLGQTPPVQERSWKQALLRITESRRQRKIQEFMVLGAKSG